MKLKRQSAVKLMEDSVTEPLGVPYVALAARVKGWGASGLVHDWLAVLVC